MQKQQKRSTVRNLSAPQRYRHTQKRKERKQDEMNKREMWSASGTEFLRIRYGNILQVCTTTCLHSVDCAEKAALTHSSIYVCSFCFIYLFVYIGAISLCVHVQCAYAFTFTLFMICHFCNFFLERNRIDLF